MYAVTKQNSKDSEAEVIYVGNNISEANASFSKENAFKVCFYELNTASKSKWGKAPVEAKKVAKKKAVAESEK